MMGNTDQIRVHWGFWVVTALALLWNLLTAANFLAQMNGEILAGYRDVERIIVEGRPVWATGAFALAAFGGLLGSIFLLLKKSVAVLFFMLSLLGVVGTMLHALGLGIEFSRGELAGIVVMPVLVPVFLIWFSRFAANRGWLR